MLFIFKSVRSKPQSLEDLGKIHTTDTVYQPLRCQENQTLKKYYKTSAKVVLSSLQSRLDKINVQIRLLVFIFNCLQSSVFYIYINIVFNIILIETRICICIPIGSNGLTDLVAITSLIFLPILNSSNMNSHYFIHYNKGEIKS